MFRERQKQGEIKNKKMRDLRKYDKFLNLVRSLNGAKNVLRQSPFNSIKRYEVLNIKNKYIGSANWLLRKIISMDSQRFDLVGKANQHNKNLYHKKDDNRVTKEIADYFFSGGDNINI